MPEGSEPVVEVAQPVVPPVVEPVVQPVTPVTVVPAAKPVEPVVETVPKVEPILEVPNKNFAESAKATLSEAGLNSDDIMQEINSNNGEVSVELYNKLHSTLGAAKADLLVNGYKQVVAETTAKQNAENAKVFALVGGKEQWDKIAEWTATPDSGLSKEASEVYNEMLAEGGVKAALAANALKEAYMASPGFEQPANMMQGDGPPAPTGITPISRQEYSREKMKAYNSNDGVAVQALENRAKYTMQNHANVWRSAKING